MQMSDSASDAESRGAAAPPAPPRVQLIDDDEILLEVVSQALRSAGFEVERALNAEAGIERFRASPPDLAIVDVHLPGLDGFAFVEMARSVAPEVPLLMLSAVGGGEAESKAAAAGAHRFLTKDLDAESLIRAVREALGTPAVEGEVLQVSAPAPLWEDRYPILGQSVQMQRLRNEIAAVARSGASVMVVGEPGTGKDLVARALHALSGRSGDFVPINCAAVPEGLIERMFLEGSDGSGASGRRSRGGFARLQGGTLLLDEITALRPDLQIALVRALQTQELDRNAGSDSPLDVRVITTSSTDPGVAVREHRLREELMYRLDIVRLELPALRDRREDIPELATAFVASAAQQFGRPVPRLSNSALVMLERHDWPGNVRQLQHVIQRAVIMSRGRPIEAHHIVLPSAGAPTSGVTSSGLSSVGAGLLPTLNIGELERAAIAQALSVTNGNRMHAARLLGIHVRTLHRKLHEGLSP